MTEAEHIDGLVQENRNSSALAMELRLSCTKPLSWVTIHKWHHPKPRPHGRAMGCRLWVERKLTMLLSHCTENIYIELNMLTPLMLEPEPQNTPALGVDTMPADALTPKSLVHQQVWYWLCRTHSIYCCSRFKFHLLGLSQIQDQDTIQSVNISFIIFKTTPHVKS